MATAGPTTRRNVLESTLAMAVLGAAGVPDWVMPALAQGEIAVPFTDWPTDFTTTPNPERRLIDTRAIVGPFTPAGEFFTLQHYGQPAIEAASFRLQVTGLVGTPLSLSLDDLRSLGSTDLVAGFEGSGNRRPLQGLCSNGRWTGVPQG